MITGAAFCPHPPVLVPDLAQRAAVELDEVRAACREAIRRVAAPGVQLVVLGAGEATTPYPATARGSFAGYGLDLEVPLGSDAPGPAELPLSLAVGAWLLRDALGPDSGAVGWSIGPDGLDRLPIDGPVALLVMGDGSARRSLKAPGYLDDRAAAFDGAVAAILAEGDAAALTGIDDELTDDLLAAGGPAWRAAGALLLDAEWDADLLADDATYGVGYFAAAWTRRG